MTQIPILSGTYTDPDADFRSSYPVNLVPVPRENGIANGYLAPADGVVSYGDGLGFDRGGINWRGTHYRVQGGRLVSISQTGAITDLGSVGGTGQVTFDYSFDRLAVSSSGALFYLQGGALTKVTDPDLGTVIDFAWIDGYFVTTDGTSLVVTELLDPTAVDPLKYGSSEADPDPINRVLKIRNELYAVNRNTIEVFDNIGGETFPFQRIEGAQIQKGSLGTYCACEFSDAVAFLGSGRNEAPSIYIGQNAGTTKIATREIDQILATFTEAELSKCLLEKRVDKGHQHLWVHLPDRTMVYDLAASAVIGQPVWYYLTSGLAGFSQYTARNLVWVYDKWYVGQPSGAKMGYLNATVSTQYGEMARWEFGTTIIYNEGNGAVFHDLELVCLTGRVALGIDPTISTSYSIDGETWSDEKFLSIGTIGNRTKRIAWRRNGIMRNWRIQRFKGNSDSHIAITRLEAQLEPLAV